MTLHQSLWSRVCSWARTWMHGAEHEDWYRRQIEANDFDRECAEKGRGQ